MDITKPCRDISELKPIARNACYLFLSECKRAGLDIFITETYRSQARQNYLYGQGRTRAGQIVTWTKSSNHTGRMAWDIACNRPSLYDEATLKKAGEVAKKLGITWGGSWSTPDMPHFEIAVSWKAPKEDEEEMLKERFEPMEQSKLTPGQKNMLNRLIEIGAVAKNYKPSLNSLETMSIIDSAFKNSGFYAFAKSK